MGSLSAPQQYCLRWNNHTSNLLLVFEDLFLTETFTDVTVACDGKSLKCHKMVLAACSSYFRHLLMTNDCPHPIFILKDIRFSEMRAILEYMYKGEVNLTQDQLAGFLKAAKSLKVKGLVEANESLSETRSPYTNQSPYYPNSNNAAPDYFSTSTYNDKTNSLPTTRTADFIFDSPCNSNSVPERNVLPYQLRSSSSSSSNKNQMATSAAHGVSTVSFGNSYNKTISLKKKKINSTTNKDDTSSLRKVLGHTTSLQTNNNAENSTQSLKIVNFYTLARNPANDGSKSSSDTIDTPTADFPEHSSGRGDHMEKDNHSFTMEGEEKSGVGIGTCVPSQKPELTKCYKKYTRSDLMAAIAAMKGGMSARQADRKYGVPSRTLYDKVKNLGITTNRPYSKLLNTEKSSSSYSPEDEGEVSGGGNGNGMEGENSMADSESSLSVRDQGSPIYEREIPSNPINQGRTSSSEEPERSGQNNVTASDISSSTTTSPEAMDFIEPEGSNNNPILII